VTRATVVIQHVDLHLVLAVVLVLVMLDIVSPAWR
jgi:hypothetical protein